MERELLSFYAPVTTGELVNAAALRGRLSAAVMCAAARMPDFANMLNEISVKASGFTMAARDDKVEAACPACRQRLRLPRHRVGKVECPRCGDRFEADTNTVVLDEIDLRKFALEPASTITYRIQKSRKNTGLFFACFSVGISSPFLAIIFFVSSYLNNWQSTYLNDALTLCILSFISWLVIILGGNRHYIDIEPTEVYSSKLDITIKYRGICDITKYLEPKSGNGHILNQTNSYLRYADVAPVPVPQGDVQILHINSYEGKSIDISRDYTAYIEAIKDLIETRVAIAKAPTPIAWS